MLTTAIPSSRTQPRLRVLAHVDDLPSGIAEPLRLGLGREPGALDDDDRAAFMDFDAVVADRVDRELAQDRVVDVRGRQVGDDRAVVERVDPAMRAVDELVAHHEVAGLDRELQRARGTRRDHGLDPERAHRPDIGPVVDPVWRDGVPPAMPRDERDPSTIHVREEYRVRWRAVGRVHLHLAHVVEQRVEARTLRTRRSPPYRPRRASVLLPPDGRAGEASDSRRPGLRLA